MAVLLEHIAYWVGDVVFDFFALDKCDVVYDLHFVLTLFFIYTVLIKAIGFEFMILCKLFKI